DARSEILVSVRHGLAIVAEAEIESQIAAHVKTILHEEGVQPLLQCVRADPEIDRLRVLLHVVECELIERSCRCVLDCKRAEHGSSRFASESAGRVMHQARAKAQVMAAA